MELNLFKKRKKLYYIKYRWVTEDLTSSWGIYRAYSNKEERDRSFQKLRSTKQKSYEEFKIN